MLRLQINRLVFLYSMSEGSSRRQSSGWIQPENMVTVRLEMVPHQTEIWLLLHLTELLGISSQASPILLTISKFFQFSSYMWFSRFTNYSYRRLQILFWHWHILFTSSPNLLRHYIFFSDFTNSSHTSYILVLLPTFFSDFILFCPISHIFLTLHTFFSTFFSYFLRSSQTSPRVFSDFIHFSQTSHAPISHIFFRLHKFF